jgi:hypothetical protein
MTRKGLSPLQVYIDTIRVISRYQRLEYTEAQSLLLISLRKGSGDDDSYKCCRIKGAE